MGEEKKRKLTPEEVAKQEEADVQKKAQAIFQKKMDSARLEVAQVLEKYGLDMQVQQNIVFVPRQQR